MKKSVFRPTTSSSEPASLRSEKNLSSSSTSQDSTQLKLSSENEVNATTAFLNSGPQAAAQRKTSGAIENSSLVRGQQSFAQKVKAGSSGTAQLWGFRKKKGKAKAATPDPAIQPEVSYEEAIANYSSGPEDQAKGVAEFEGELIGSVADTTGGTQAAPTFTDANSGDNGTIAATGQDQVDKSAGEQQAEAFGVGVSLAAPILSFYLAVKKLGSGELNDQIEGGFELLASGSSAVKAGADVAKTLDSNDKGAATTSAIAGSVTDGLNGLKDGVLAIKQIYDAYKDATSEEGSSKSDKIAAGLQVTKSLVSSASGVIASLKAILDLFKAGSASIANAVPGLGIALSAVQIAIDVYDIIKAKTNESFIKEQLKSNKWEMVLGKGKKKRKTQDDNKALFKSEISRFETELTVLKEKQAALNAAGKTAEADALDEQISSKEEMYTLAVQEFSSLEKNIALTNLKQVNVDKSKNSAFSIGVELTKVIGSVLSLVPEPGSQVASVTLKAAASGASLAKKAGDKIKQSARDYASKNPGSKLNKVVDTTRSSDKELARKKASVKYIFDAISNVDLENKKAVNDVSSLIDTSGMSAQSLLRSFNSGGVTEAVSAMIKAQG